MFQAYAAIITKAIIMHDNLGLKVTKSTEIIFILLVKHKQFLYKVS